MASVQKSSFHKRGIAKKNLIRGTSPSIHNSQLLISSGIPSFDGLIGGGIPVGSLILINEDEYGKYAKLMVKYFLAEGIVSKHAIFLCTDIQTENLIQELPAPVDVDTKEANVNEAFDKMTIAWRYENLKKATLLSNSHRHFGHYFDLSKTMDVKVINESDITTFSPNQDPSCGTFQDSAYYNLLKSIQKKLEEGIHFTKQTNPDRNILRIALFHLNSPFWRCNSNSQSEKFLLTFLYSLRALIRNAFATCYISLPYSKHKKELKDECIHLTDISIELQSISNTKFEKLAPFKDYNGFFVIQKLAAINSLVAHNPQTPNLAFKLKRKKFVIEDGNIELLGHLLMTRNQNSRIMWADLLCKISVASIQAFSLPPELDDTSEREQDDSLMTSCFSPKSKKLDF